jgi:non-specific serine/threonine protein kinase
MTLHAHLPSGPAEAESVPIALAISPNGVFHLDPNPPPGCRLPSALAANIKEAFSTSPRQGLLHLGTALLEADLPPSLAFGRELVKLCFTHLCTIPELDALDALDVKRDRLTLPAPIDELEALAGGAPPMTGAEYLSAKVLTVAWGALLDAITRELVAFEGPAHDYLRAKSPLWNAVGRVHFHLVENKRDELRPFAFLATYATHLSKHARVQHAPLGRAIDEYAGARDRQKLLALLSPVHKAAEKSPVLKALVDSGEIFHPLAWTPREAFAFLKDMEAYESSGVIVRVPDFWRAKQPPRPEVRVTVGGKRPAGLGADAMLDFEVSLVLNGEPLSAAEMRRILAATEPLVLLKGQWIEVDREKLNEVLDRWKRIEAQAAREGISFLEGMRLLSGVTLGPSEEAAGMTAAAWPAWTRVTAGPWLERLLSDLRHPESSGGADPGEDLQGTLRPYQRAGVAWLWLLSSLRIGACLADDMGLGKTLQVLSLLLLHKNKGAGRAASRKGRNNLGARPLSGPHLVVAPASLLGNWRAEAARFAPSLKVVVAHPSAMNAASLTCPSSDDLAGADLILTTYGTVLRTPWFAERTFGLVVLDEAQAIKNPDAKQTRAVKRLKSGARVALTGTPIENRLSDLWSIFDFLCPGLLGSPKAFQGFVKRLEADPGRGYAPLRKLVSPYILRRLKSDKSVIADLPDKTELTAYCSLTKTQASLYAKAVEELATALATSSGIKRRGIVLAYLMRFKQICNHPSQWLGDGAYRPEHSGKLARLRELCEPIAARQEKVLVFTQFREMTGPLAAFLADIFGRPGLVLHGETPVEKRASLVAEFQRDEGPPSFVLSLKAGGTGLNLTGASHVVHFDRWWNPSVENQATDRAYRIGQKKNVLVHKFVCRGTIEERIEALLASKRGLADDILAGGGEAWITELDRERLLELVSLDLERALEEG